VNVPIASGRESPGGSSRQSSQRDGRDDVHGRSLDVRFVFRSVTTAFVVIAATIACYVAWTMTPALGVMLALPLVLSAVLDRSALGAWAFRGFVVLVFIILRTGADETSIRWQGEYVAEWDALIAFGSNPTAVLQNALRHPWLDAVASWTYISFFVFPTLVALAVWWRGKRFQDFVVASAIVHAIAIIVHYAVPTIPPWMASASGMIEPINRIFMDVMLPSAPQIMEAGYRASANDVAAMPSVHMAIATLAALAAMRLGKAIGIAVWAYAALMLFSITYLGEHYVVDGLAGIVVAIVAWRLAPPVANRMFPPRPSSLHPAGSRLPDPASQIAQ
jgi:membrane-associated phospholipid phosphatase